MNFKENESEKKLRGGYYTDPSIASYLLKWVLEKRPKSILEPSCGDGVFFRCLKKFNTDSIEQLTGFEIEPDEAEKSSSALDEIQNINSFVLNIDFLQWFLNRPVAVSEFDAVVGNPPFIRYQYLEEEQQVLAEAIFDLHNLKFTKHTNAWVPFVIASIALLNPGGRLAMVLPSELFHIKHAASLREFLTQQCSKLLIFDPQKLWFEETLQGAILLMAEKKESSSDKSQGIEIIQVKNKNFLHKEPKEYFREAEFVNGNVLQGNWMKAFLSSSELALLERVKKLPKVYSFDEIADVAVGIVTGANKFFLVTDDIVEKYNLNRWAYPMFGRSEHVPGVIYDESVHEKNKQKKYPTNFLWFDNEKFETLPSKVKDYIQFGENQGLHTRYKCRIREPWYSVPSVYSTDVGMLKRSHNYPRLIYNQISAYTTDTSYRIKAKGVTPLALVYSFVNSLTVLSAELEGRHYGGGVLELVPSEIRRLIVPIVDATEEDLYRLDQNIRESGNPEDVLIPQDQVILKRIGLSKSEIITLRNAWQKMRLRRQRKDAP